MDILEAIRTRRSVRRYKDIPLTNEQVATLEKKVQAVNAEGNLHIQLVTNERKAFNGKMAYGTFHGVSNYFVMIGKKDDTLSERIGYYGEQLVLLAQQLGLNTCWVGLTYNNVREAYTIGKDEKLCCMIALGHGDDAGRNLKRKGIADVSNTDKDTPEWFVHGVEAALLAPTAVNQQKFFLEYLPATERDKAQVRATRKFSLFGYTKMDLGIVKLHFEIGAGKEHFEWG